MTTNIKNKKYLKLIVICILIVIFFLLVKIFSTKEKSRLHMERLYPLLSNYEYPDVVSFIIVGKDTQEYRDEYFSDLVERKVESLSKPNNLVFESVCSLKEKFYYNKSSSKVIFSYLQGLLYKVEYNFDNNENQTLEDTYNYLLDIKKVFDKNFEKIDKYNTDNLIQNLSKDEFMSYMSKDNESRLWTQDWVFKPYNYKELESQTIGLEMLLEGLENIYQEHNQELILRLHLLSTDKSNKIIVLLWSPESPESEHFIYEERVV